MQIVDKFILKMNREGVLSLSFLLTQSDSFVEFLVSYKYVVNLIWADTNYFFCFTVHSDSGQ